MTSGKVINSKLFQSVAAAPGGMVVPGTVPQGTGQNRGYPPAYARPTTPQPNRYVLA